MYVCMGVDINGYKLLKSLSFVFTKEVNAVLKNRIEILGGYKIKTNLLQIKSIAPKIFLICV